LVVLFAGLIVALIIFNNLTKPESDKLGVWNEAMTIGEPSAEHHFIEYVDMLCPYCAKYQAALESHRDEFQRDYIDTGKVYYELRLADIVSEHNVNSYRGNLAGYCAARQGKEQFWRYYNAVQDYMTETYYSRGIGDQKGAPEVPHFGNEVYHDLARDVDLDLAQFTPCLDDEETKTELDRNSAKARATGLSGVPYFVFNSYRSSGFDGTYSTIQQMFRAGGAV
jgi:protein-disulfide isomerase